MPGELSLLVVPCSRENGAEDRLVYILGTGRDSESLWNMKPREMKRKNTRKKRQKRNRAGRKHQGDEINAGRKTKGFSKHGKTRQEQRDEGGHSRAGSGQAAESTCGFPHEVNGPSIGSQGEEHVVAHLPVPLHLLLEDTGLPEPAIS